MEHPVGLCFTNGRKHSAGHALHSTAAPTGSLHAINSFDLAGPAWQCPEALDLTWSFSFLLCLSPAQSFFLFFLWSSFIYSCSLSLHRQQRFRRCHCRGDKWGIMSNMEKGRTRLMCSWNTVSVKTGPTTVTAEHGSCQGDLRFSVSLS